MVDDTSRYAKIGTYSALDSDGKVKEGFGLRVTPPAPGFFFHSPGPHERLDTMADDYFKDPKKFWKICDASDHLDPFDVIRPGIPVLIPQDA